MNVYTVFMYIMYERVHSILYILYERVHSIYVYSV